MIKAELVSESKGSARNLLDKVVCSKEKIPHTDYMFNPSYVDKKKFPELSIEQKSLDL
jgi:hypothetical protein